MAPILLTVTHPHTSGVLKNNVVNTFCITTPSVAYVETEMAPVITALGAFYNTVYGGHSVGGMIGEQITRTTNSVIRTYDLTGALNGQRHGSPKAAYPLNLPASETGNEMPSELAVCLSFRTAYGTDVEFGPGTRPRASDRGRIYIGPLTDALRSYDAPTGRVYINSIFRTSLVQAAQAFRDAPNFAWAVWSRRRGTTDPVTNVWVDDAFDIQRRRGEDAVARTSG